MIVKKEKIPQITKGIEKFYALKNHNNSQAVGVIAQGLIVEIINKTTNGFAKDVSKENERKNSETDLLINDEPYSLKTASNKKFSNLIIQLTTNYSIREKIEEDKEWFEEFRKVKKMFLLFDETKESYGIFLFDNESYLNDIYKIKEKKNRIHTDYILLTKDNYEIGKIKYGKNQANAFQRGIWIEYIFYTKKYFIPIINWTKFDINNNFILKFLEE